MEIAIGVDIGGTNTKIGLVNKHGELLDFTTFPTTDPQSFDTFVSKTKEQSLGLISKNSIAWENILGVGVGAPNGNYQNGHIESPTNLKQWGTVDLVRPFTSEFKLPIKLDNDANVAALGEGKWGGAKNLKDFIVVTLGTGIGTGAVSDGQLIRGGNGLATEGGHMTLFKDGRPCGCGGFGHLEMYASVRGIKITVKELIDKELSFKEISERYHAGDNIIHEAFKITADHLGQGIAMMASFMAPEAIFLAGGVATIGEEFCIDVEVAAKKYVYSNFKEQVKVSISSISTSQGAVLGAASQFF